MTKDQNLNLGSTLLKIITVLILFYGAYQLDAGGKMLANVQVSVNDIRSSMGQLTNTVTALARQQDLDHRAIAALQDRR